MSDDDKQHEYVPHEWRDIAVGTRDECRERLDAAQAEANNLTEALRQVNARLAQMTKELVFLGSIAHFMPEPGLSLLRPTATPAALKLQAHIVRLWRLIETADGERDSYRARAEKAEDERDAAKIAMIENERGSNDVIASLREQVRRLIDERDAARQSRKRAVWAVSVRADEFCQLGGGLRKIIEGLEVERDVARQTTRVWKARAEKCEAERALSQQRESDHSDPTDGWRIDPVRFQAFLDAFRHTGKQAMEDDRR